MHISIRKNHFELLPQRAIFWMEQQALILSDLHLGKGMHFRKEGIPIPKDLFNDDLARLGALIEEKQPQKLFIVGDMFHSHSNNEVHLFEVWRAQYEQPQFLLIKGNHDILSSKQYRDLGLETHKTLAIDGFLFSHDIATSDDFCIYGHLHPGVKIHGKGRQKIELPCFHITPEACTLPAFGRFTGLAFIDPCGNDRVYAIAENMIMEIRC